MLFELPKKATPSLACADIKEGRPALTVAYLRNRPKGGAVELVTSNAFIMAQVCLGVLPHDQGDSIPQGEYIRIPYEALKYIEKPSVRAFVVRDGWITPVEAKTGTPLALKFEVAEGTQYSTMPNWETITDPVIEAEPGVDVFEFGINDKLMGNLGKALGAQAGLRVTPGPSALRPIKVEPLGNPEHFGIIMPIRLAQFSSR